MARRKRPRGQAPSQGYRQARRVKARIEKKAARQAQHTARTWAKRVVDHHQLIAVEDFRAEVPGQVQDGPQGRGHRARRDLKAELIERAVRAGRRW